MFQHFIALSNILNGFPKKATSKKNVLTLNKRALFFPTSSWICSERPEAKPVTRTNQVRPREAQAKKQPSTTLPATSKPAGGTAAAVRHRDGAMTAIKANKAAGKAATSTQAKTNPRGAYNSSRVIGKCGWRGAEPACRWLHVALHAPSACAAVKRKSEDSTRAHRHHQLDTALLSPAASWVWKFFFNSRRLDVTNGSNVD